MNYLIYIQYCIRPNINKNKQIRIIFSKYLSFIVILFVIFKKIYIANTNNKKYAQKMQNIINLSLVSNIRNEKDSIIAVLILSVLLSLSFKYNMSLFVKSNAI